MRNDKSFLSKRFVAGILCLAMIFGQTGSPSPVFAASTDSGYTENVEEIQTPESPDSAEGIKDTEAVETTEDVESPEDVKVTEDEETTEPAEAAEEAQTPETDAASEPDQSPETETVPEALEETGALIVDDVSYATLEQALEAVSDGGTVILKGEVSVAEWPLGQDGKTVTIAGTDESAVLVMSGDWLLTGETTFRSLSIRQGDAEAYAVDVTDYPLYLDNVELTAEMKLNPAVLPVHILNKNGELDAEWLTVTAQKNEAAMYAESVFDNVYVGVKYGITLESAPIGTQPEYPYSTMEEAMSAVEDGGTIWVVDNTKVASWPAVQNGKSVTIEGWSGTIPASASQDGNEHVLENPTIHMSSDWVLAGDTTFQRLTIQQSGTANRGIFPEGYRLQIGSGEKETNADGTPFTKHYEGSVVPCVRDTLIKNNSGGDSSWLYIVTNPYASLGDTSGTNANANPNITKVDIHIYGGNTLGTVQAYSGANHSGRDESSKQTLTPNLKTAVIEIIGSSDYHTSLVSKHWYNGMMPAFDGATLQSAEFVLAYAGVNSTHSIFRTGSDNNTRTGGNYTVDYTFDHWTSGGEGITIGETVTSGDVTANFYDSTMNGSQCAIGLGTFGGRFGNVTINLWGSRATHVSPYWTSIGARNGSISYTSLTYNLHNSQITGNAYLQDNATINLYGESSVGNLAYFQKDGSALNLNYYDGTHTLQNLLYDQADIFVAEGAKLTMDTSTDRVRNVSNNGTICVNKSMNWSGSYTGGMDSAPASLVLSENVTVGVSGSIGGKTALTLSEAALGSSADFISTLMAGSVSEGTDVTLESYEGIGADSGKKSWSYVKAPNYEEADCIYLRYGGNDEKNGQSYINAVGSIQKAYELAIGTGKNGMNKRIVLCNPYFYSASYENEVFAIGDGTVPDPEEPVLFTTSDGVNDFVAIGGAKLVLPPSTVNSYETKVVRFGGSFQFKDISFSFSEGMPVSGYATIYCGGHKTVMDTGVTTPNGTRIYGGVYNSNKERIASTNLTINDGTYMRIIGGSYMGIISERIDLTVTNCAFQTANYLQNLDTNLIYGGSQSAGTAINMTDGIYLNVTPGEEQSVTNVMRIVGGYGSVPDNSYSEINKIRVNVSGDVQFYNANYTDPGSYPRYIIGGNVSSSNANNKHYLKVSGGIDVTVQNLTEASGLLNIIGGEYVCNPIGGKITVRVDGVSNARLIAGGGGYYARSNQLEEYLPEIEMHIGETAPVTVDSIFGGSGNTNSRVGNVAEMAVQSARIILGDVTVASILSASTYGITASEEGKVKTSIMQSEGKSGYVRDVSGVGAFTNKGTFTLTGENLEADTVRLAAGSDTAFSAVSAAISGDYIAEEKSTITVNTLAISGKVSGVTNVRGTTDKSDITITATTVNVAGADENVRKGCFENAGFIYEETDGLSVWKYESNAIHNRKFVYVDGVSGNDEWRGEQATPGTNSEGTDIGPVKTLVRAYELAHKDGTGVIIVCGPTTIAEWPSDTTKVTVTSDAALVPAAGDTADYRDSGAYLYYIPASGDNYMHLSGDVTLRNLNFRYTFDGDGYGGIDANGYTLIVGAPLQQEGDGDAVNSRPDDVKFLRVKDGTVDAVNANNRFSLIGGGRYRQSLEKIDLQVYNACLGDITAVWGSPADTPDKPVVSGNLTFIAEDVYSYTGLGLCAQTNQRGSNSNGYYCEIQGSADIQVSTYNKSMSPRSYAILANRFAKIDGDLQLYYKNRLTSSLEYPNYVYCTPHCSGNAVVTFDGGFKTQGGWNGRYHLTDLRTNADRGENASLTINFIGRNTPIAYMTGTGGYQGAQSYVGSLDLVINIGDAVHGSEGINFANHRIESGGSSLQFRSMVINYYPGSDLSFDFGYPTYTYTTKQDSKLPIVVYHNLEGDTQTEYTLSDPKVVNKAILEADGSKIIRTTDASEAEFGIFLVNGGVYQWEEDDLTVNGDVKISGQNSRLLTNGTVSVTGNMTLDHASFEVENILNVGGTFAGVTDENGQPTSTLTMGLKSGASAGAGTEANLNAVSGVTTVNFKGDASEGSSDLEAGFVIYASKGGDAESYAKDRFTGGMDKNGVQFELAYTEGAENENACWSLGSIQGIEGEIYLNATAGSDSNNGATPATAVRTLKRAIEVAIEKYADGSGKATQKIIFSGKYMFENDANNQMPVNAESEVIALPEGCTIVLTQQSSEKTYGSRVTVASGFEIPCALTFENIKLSFTASSADRSELYAGGHALVIGENVTVQSAGTYAPILYGGTADGAVESTSLNVLSGHWFRIFGGGKNGSVNGNTNVVLGDGVKKIAPVFDGQDGDFNSISTPAVFGGGESGSVSGSANVTILYGSGYGHIYGGGQSGNVTDTNVTIDHMDAAALRVYGGGYRGEVVGTAAVTLASGTVNRIYGGGEAETSTAGKTSVTIGGGADADPDSAQVRNYLRGSGSRGGVTDTATLTIQGGALIPEGCDVAAGGYTGGVGTSILNVSGGIVKTNLFAGGAGEIILSGENQGQPDPMKGVVSASKANITGGIVTGNIYGGGNLGSVGTGTMSGTTDVNLTGGHVTGNVYGGGKMAATHGNINLTVDMIADTVTNDTHTSFVSGSIFGGAEGNSDTAADVYGTVTVNIENANITASQPDDRDFSAIYGGGDVNGTVGTVSSEGTITGGTVVNVTTRPGCRVFGGGRGAATVVRNSAVTLDYGTAADTEETLYSVYGGGNLGMTTVSHVTVNAWTGDIFGGGRGYAEKAGIITNFKNALRGVGNFFSTLFTGEAAYAIDGLEDANTGETYVTIDGIVNGYVYGGGELATVGNPGETELTRRVTHVIINDAAKLGGDVFGGGCGREGAEFATIYGSTEVIVNGGIALDSNSVFGGGQNAPVLGGTNVTLNGGELVSVFGGNEMSGAINLSTSVAVPGNSTATVENLYGGGLEAPYDGTGTEVSIAGGNIVNAYGGGFGSTAAARHASVTVTGGRVETLYGGGEEATVTETASIKVNVPDTSAETIGILYCGNNLAEMKIQPTINLSSGKIGTFYGGGNKGAMTVSGGLNYDLNGSNLMINTVYGGCNQADVPGGVSLILTAGSYGTVYGGNNQSGSMPSTQVELAGATVGTTATDAAGTKTTTGGIYGGGNRAETGSTRVILTSGTASDIYGGGNAATVTDSVSISAPKSGKAVVTNLFCGNNQADMDIQPVIELKSGTVWTFYGGGNAGAMTYPDGLTYTFDQQDMHFTYIIGGCNAADVTSDAGVTLNLNGVSVNAAVYGGCNERGNVQKTSVNILGDVSPVSSAFTSVFGGGRGEQTTVGTASINAQNGTVRGSLYGGSGFGRVTDSHIMIKERDDQTDDRIVITGDVFGAGYGESSVTGSTDVLIDMRLRIHDPNMDSETQTDASKFDLYVTEKLVSTDTVEGDTESGETSVQVHWLNEGAVSRIGGNVYGGGDMGKVGKGMIHSGTNTADISEDGYTHVRLVNGFVAGDLFGGGSGKPEDGMSYSLYMGAVFGCCQMDITGGYVSGNVYGGGYQSRVYANPASKIRLPLYFDPTAKNGVPAEDALHENVLAAQVNIAETEFDAGTYAVPIIIGSSVFGGGAKGEGTSTNPTVYTIVGDVEVNIIGQHGTEAKTRSTAIYFDQTMASGGGIYGDGNLCLVSGEKTVNIRCFNVGYGNAAGDEMGEKVNILKTFYSLQRADTVNVRHSKFILRGAEDLVDENADGTLFSINRVEQLNMYENSTIKLIRIVNYLGGLWSDEHYTTRYINRGNNGMNHYTTRNGVGTDYAYETPPEGTDLQLNGMFHNPDGSIRRMLQNNNRVIHYRNAYMEYVYGKGKYQEPYNEDENTEGFDDLNSFNEICVANGKYLEIKKSDTEYGDVKGVFILSLLRATPGTGGGFVYAAIGDKEELNSGSTGAFVCVTKDTSGVDNNGNPLPEEEQPYMIISHNVGGYRTQTNGTRDYSYYYWYIKGNKYVYDIDVLGYIGTADTDFESSAVLTEMEGRRYILKSITGPAPSDKDNESNLFYSGRLVDHWDDTLKESDNYALELKVVSHVGADNETSETSIGFLRYNEADGRWEIKKTDGAECVYGKGTNMDQEQWFKPNDLIQVAAGTTNMELMVVLHKGNGVLTEIRDVPVTLEFDVYDYFAESDRYDTVNNASAVQIKLSTSIIRLVPTQDVYLSAGRIYAGVPNDLDIRITGDSAFTVQYITKFMPSAFNTATAKMRESLTTAGEEIYLLDQETGVGFTLNAGGTLIHATEGLLSDYTINKSDGSYKVTYHEGTTHASVGTSTLIQPVSPLTEVSFPKGTMITMIAQIDSYTPTYWYYYCTEETSTIDLENFVKMNTESETFDFEKASGNSVSYTASQRVTENFSFIFDFSQTDLSKEAASETVDMLTGHLRLLHTFISGGQEIDIMDAVSSRSEKGEGESSKIIYTRNYPAVSKTFAVAGGTGWLNIEIKPIEDGLARDTYDVTFTISENNSLGENTRYDEREYAVLLECVDERGNSTPFPAGTTFTYNGQFLKPGNNNRSVCVPVQTSGTHTVTMQTEMTGFPEGDVRLKAMVYASPDASYHNELDTGKEITQRFAVTENPAFALSARQAQDIHLYSAGDKMTLTVQTKSALEGDTEPVMVRLFRYDRSGKDYAPVGSLSEIFDSAQESCMAGSWEATVTAKAAPGTYRLEFRYHDKVEYWDFIVR